MCAISRRFWLHTQNAYNCISVRKALSVSVGEIAKKHSQARQATEKQQPPVLEAHLALLNRHWDADSTDGTWPMPKESNTMSWHDLVASLLLVVVLVVRPGAPSSWCVSRNRRHYVLSKQIGWCILTRHIMFALRWTCRCFLSGRRDPLRSSTCARGSCVLESSWDVIWVTSIQSLPSPHLTSAVKLNGKPEQAQHRLLSNKENVKKRKHP